MSTGIRNAITVAALLAATISGAGRAQPFEPTVIIATFSPSRPVVLPGGDLLIGTRGTLPDTGGVMFVDGFGSHATILGGLPFAGGTAYLPGDVNGDKRFDIADVLYLINRLFGGGAPPVSAHLQPDGMAARGDALYIATGEIVRAQRSASPDRSAVLRVTFSAGLGFNESFFLGPEKYGALLDGDTVILTHSSSDTASVSLLVNGFPAISDLTVDEEAGRLYIQSRLDGSTSFIPLE